MIQAVHPRSGARYHDFLPIPDPGVKKDPESATLGETFEFLGVFSQVPFGVRIVASGATGRADKLAQDAAGQLTRAVSQGVAPAHRPSNISKSKVQTTVY
jgi:hypothetical protein